MEAPLLLTPKPIFQLPGNPFEDKVISPGRQENLHTASWEGARRPRGPSSQTHTSRLRRAHVVPAAGAGGKHVCSGHTAAQWQRVRQRTCPGWAWSPSTETTGAGGSGRKPFPPPRASCSCSSALHALLISCVPAVPGDPCPCRLLQGGCPHAAGWNGLPLSLCPRHSISQSAPCPAALGPSLVRSMMFPARKPQIPPSTSHWRPAAQTGGLHGSGSHSK